MKGVRQITSRLAIVQHVLGLGWKPAAGNKTAIRHFYFYGPGDLELEVNWYRGNEEPSFSVGEYIGTTEPHAMQIIAGRRRTSIETKTISIEELAQRPNSTFHVKGEVPNLFEIYWSTYRIKAGLPEGAKTIARDAWVACATELGVYD